MTHPGRSRCSRVGSPARRSSAGSAAWTLVPSPARFSTRHRPPSSSARSIIEERPKPVAVPSRPIPSSSTVTVTVCPAWPTAISHRLACECLATLVTASATIAAWRDWWDCCDPLAVHVGGAAERKSGPGSRGPAWWSSPPSRQRVLPGAAPSPAARALASACARSGTPSLTRTTETVLATVLLLTCRRRLIA